MRMAVDILSAALGGPGQYIRNLLPFLSRRAEGDDEIHVLAAHPALIARLQADERVRVHGIAQGRRVVSRLWWQYARLPAWCRDHRIDAVFVAQGLTAMRSGPPMAVLHQDSLFFSSQRFGRPWWYVAAQLHFSRATLKRACEALFVSEYIRGLAEQRGWIAPGLGRIVPYGVNVKELRGAADAARLHELRGGQPFALCVNSVMPHKNVHSLVEAMRILRDRGRTDIRLLIAGEAPADRPYAERIRRQISDAGLGDAVRLLGPADRPELSALYQSARLYVTVSNLEAHPLTPVEAMGLGAPVLCSNLPPFREVCDDAADYVDGNDPASLASAVATIWDDARRRQELIDRGRRRAERFSWTRAADEIYCALQRAARRRGCT